MKDCIKQTELTNGTPAHINNLTKLEILYRQLQQRHQYDLEQHFAITESLKIKAKDAQSDLQKLQRECEEMQTKFHDEQAKSAAKVNFIVRDSKEKVSLFNFRSLNLKVNYVMLIQQQS